MLRRLFTKSSPQEAEKQESTLADVPLLSNPDDQADEDEKASLEKEEEKAKSKANQKTTKSNFLRIFSYSTTADKLLLLIAIIASIFTGATLPLMNVVFGHLVGVFNDFYNPESGRTRSDFTSSINKYVLYLVCLFASRLSLDYIAILGFRKVSIRVSAAIRLAYLKALFHQPISVLDTLPPGQTAAIITITANTLQNGISEKLSTLVQSVSLVITALVVAFHYSHLLTLVTGSGLLFIVISYCITTPRLVNMMKEVEHADRTSSAIAGEVFGSIKMVAACEAEVKMAKRYGRWAEESLRRGLLLSPVVALHHAPAFFAIHATFALSFWYAVRLYLKHDIVDVATVIIVLMSIMTIVMSIGGVAAPASAAAQAAGAASVLFTIIDAPQPQTNGIRASEACSQNDIVFENVNFAYPTRPDVRILDNLNVKFPAGKVTAIVGASGTGKSTIVGLLEHWYELKQEAQDANTLHPCIGTITIGGRNLNEMDLNSWRSQIGLVQQEPFLFNDTVYKNVEYGLIGTKWETASVVEKVQLVLRACKDAYAHDFIVELPQGYDTVVGDAGLRLSGGQRQRLAIARSIVKKPSILIFDEATSAIDVHGERIVQEALDRVSENRTTITIAHRLSTIVAADSIIVLDKGKVAQQGTHEELINDKAGSYWALASAQVLSRDRSYVGNPDFPDSGGEIDNSTDLSDLRVTDDEEENVSSQDTVMESKGSSGSFWLLLWEQRPLWRWYSLLLMGTLSAGASFPLHAFLFAKLISAMNLLGQALRTESNWWCLMFVFLAVSVSGSYYMLGWSSNTVSFHITSTYRRGYFQNVLFKPLSYFDEEGNSVGSLTARIASDPAQLQQLLGINMAIVLISIFNILGSIAMSFYFGWKLTLVTLLTSMPIILAAGFFRMRYETQLERMNHEVFAESSKFATESIGAIRTVSSLTLETNICSRYEDLLQMHTKKAFRKAKLSTLIFAMSDSIALLCMAFVLWYGGQLLADREYSPFNYLVVYLAIVQGSTSAGQSLSFGPNIAQATAAADRIRQMRFRVRTGSREPSLDFDSHGQSEKGSAGVRIELRNIWFRYPTRDIPVLKGLNMTIEKGQFAAIVGPSGKEPLPSVYYFGDRLNLPDHRLWKDQHHLFTGENDRFYDIDSGKILYEGRNVQDISLDNYRKSISLVAQEPFLFDGSIRENILLGVDEANTSDEDLHGACRDAEIHHFISSLPEGYDTLVGGKGVALSGGQKQRIAIARALIRNPQLLLLDEATSNLDSETERLIQAVFEKTAKGRTMIVVAHRLTTIQNADVIFVIGDGGVVEAGNHATLLAKRGFYYRMCQMQSLSG
ncbi:MAG: hypothetical protein M1821_007651 [Bathelium mastoideum]|nr:MAG: hypothetical protein M1821_007651 [Bathelium mastoideum]